jgi:hypothetical protein
VSPEYTYFISRNLYLVSGGNIFSNYLILLFFIFLFVSNVYTLFRRFFSVNYDAEKDVAEYYSWIEFSLDISRLTDTSLLRALQIL